MLHQRSDKSSHIATILYEIDMFRHCSKTLAVKRASISASEEAQCEYYLAIEGFLLHLRNLIAFFSTDHSRPPDLVLNDPKVWLGRNILEKEYADLRDRMRAFNDAHSETLYDGKKVNCYNLISKFLQHCTPARYENAVGWEAEAMTAELEPVLSDFIKRFAPAAREDNRARVSESNHGTATVTVGTPILKELGS